LIGVKCKDTEREVIENILTASLVELSDDFIGIKVKNFNSERTFRIEQCLSLLLSECFKIGHPQGSFANDCVIVVSPWWEKSKGKLSLIQLSLWIQCFKTYHFNLSSNLRFNASSRKTSKRV
jgi:hypothetical protein